MECQNVVCFLHQQRKEQERNREYNEFLKGSHGYGGHTQIGSLVSLLSACGSPAIVPTT